ncbi:MAG: WYL domain-containing protein, partial [Prevotella sp.]|nr:WYL domain-containing protein [Prevotella sp.]
SKTWTYIISNPIHDRQKVDPVNMTVRLHVIENPHLYQKILSYGMYIEVLSPQIVRDELKKITQEMVEIYKTK